MILLILLYLETLQWSLTVPSMNFLYCIWLLYSSWSSCGLWPSSHIALHRIIFMEARRWCINVSIMYGFKHMPYDTAAAPNVRTSKQIWQTLTGLLSENLRMGTSLSEQRAHSSRPQCRQWWRRVASPNLAPHSIHSSPSLHGGSVDNTSSRRKRRVLVGTWWEDYRSEYWYNVYFYPSNSLQIVGQIKVTPPFKSIKFSFPQNYIYSIHIHNKLTSFTFG